MKHTPAPWKVAIVSGNKLGIVQDKEGGYGIGEIWRNNINNGFTAKANAKLIAAAPELLEALQLAFDLLEENESLWYLRKHYNQIRVAIAKAT